VERVGIALYLPEGRGLMPPSSSSPEQELGGEWENEGREDTDPLIPALDVVFASFPALRTVHVCIVPDYVGLLGKGLGRTAARFADSGSNLELPGAQHEHGGGTPQGGTRTQWKQTQRLGTSTKTRGVRSCMCATWTSCTRSGSRDRGWMGVECQAGVLGAEGGGDAAVAGDGCMAAEGALGARTCHTPSSVHPC
jgi:hypothetical protein